MNIQKERLFVLRSLSYEIDNSLVYDPFLPGVIRKALADIEKEKNEAEISRHLDKISDLYDSNGPPLIRCLLEYLYLLHSTSEIKPMFEQLIIRFMSDIAQHNHWITPVINELNNHAYSPYDTTQKMIGLIIEAGNRIEGFYEQILSNPSASFSIRFETARQVVTHEDKKHYPQLIQFVKEVCNGEQADDFRQKIVPAVELLSKTGSAILDNVITEFLDEKHGPYVISAFGDTFHQWFWENEMDIHPSKKWVRVIIQAWRMARKQKDRDRLLSILINDWSTDSIIAENVRKQLTQKLRENRLYLAPGGSRVKELVTGFIDKSWRQQKALSEQILTASLKSEDIWNQFAETIQRDKFSGWQTALAYAQANNQQQMRICNLLLIKINKRFISAFFERILAKNRFVSIAPEGQLRILSITNPSHYITAGSLEPLLKAEKELTPQAFDALKRLIDEIRKACQDPHIHYPGRDEDKIGRLQ